MARFGLTGSVLVLATVAVSLAAAAASPAPLVCRAGEMASDRLYIANLTLEAAAAWCRNSSRCAGFGAAVPYPGSCNTTAIVEAHFADSWGARRPNRDQTWTNWLVPGPRPQPPPPPYTPPPNPCKTGGEGSPKFHIMNMGVPAPHDLNSVFHYKGTWHGQRCSTVAPVCTQCARWIRQTLYEKSKSNDRYRCPLETQLVCAFGWRVTFCVCFAQ